MNSNQIACVISAKAKGKIKVKNKLAFYQNIIHVFIFVVAYASAGGVLAKSIEQQVNYDALSSIKINKSEASSKRNDLEGDSRIKSDTEVRWHRQLNLPTFLWANTTVKTKNKHSMSELAKQYLADYADIYRLDRNNLSGAEIGSTRTYNKATIVNFKQRYQGIEVFRQEMSLLLNKQNQLVALSGHLSPHIAEMAKKNKKILFQLSNLQAAEAAFYDLSGQKQELDLVKVKNSGGYDYLGSEKKGDKYHLLKDVRVKTVLYSHVDRIIPAFYIEIMAGEQDQKIPDSYSYVISAKYYFEIT